MNLIQLGVIHSPFTQAAGTPIQPARARGAEGWVDLEPAWAPALKDLAGFDRIWLLYWFSRASEPQTEVIPYRDTVAHGLFSTRAPARPNPIGMSSVRLLGIEGHVLRVADIDILDGTPLLDIKPYVPQYDVYPAPRCGWIDGLPDRPVVADGRFEKKIQARPAL